MLLVRQGTVKVDKDVLMELVGENAASKVPDLWIINEKGFNREGTLAFSIPMLNIARLEGFFTRANEVIKRLGLPFDELTVSSYGKGIALNEGMHKVLIDEYSFFSSNNLDNSLTNVILPEVSNKLTFDVNDYMVHEFLSDSASILGSKEELIRVISGMVQSIYGSDPKGGFAETGAYRGYAYSHAFMYKQLSDLPGRRLIAKAIKDIKEYPNPNWDVVNIAGEILQELSEDQMKKIQTAYKNHAIEIVTVIKGRSSYT